MTADSTIGVAIIGLGIGEQHANAIAKHPGCELVYLYDNDANKSHELKQKLQQGEVAESFDACLQNQKVNMLIIASYDEAHFAQVIAALDAGKHVFVEKPVCQSHTQLKTLKDRWSYYDGKLKLSSNLILRAAPLYQWVKQEISNNNFGDIYAIDGDYLYGRFNKIVQGWRGKDANYSVMMGGGIHIIDLMLWFLGQRPKSVMSFANRISTQTWNGERAQKGSFENNDFVTSVFEFKSGVIGNIKANFSCVHQHQHTLRIFGTKATFIYDDMGARLHQGRDDNPQVEKIELSALPSHKSDLLPDFIHAIKTNADLNAHTQEIFDGISLCTASDISLTNQHRTSIDYL